MADKDSRWQNRQPIGRPTSQYVDFRAKCMKTLNNAREYVRERVKPGDEIVCPERGDYIGLTFTLLRFQDEWCYFDIRWPNGKVWHNKNFGFRRVVKWLMQIEKEENMLITVDGYFEGSLAQFRDCFFSNATIVSVMEWADTQGAAFSAVEREPA